jgi:hypothetical protein
MNENYIFLITCCSGESEAIVSLNCLGGGIYDEY